PKPDRSFRGSRPGDRRRPPDSLAIDKENVLMIARMLRPALLGVACGGFAVAVAAPVTYEIDSNHTYPSFEADHMGGLSIWRGKINSTRGTITLDKEAQTGTVEVTMDMSTIDFGHQGLND